MQQSCNVGDVLSRDGDRGKVLECGRQEKRRCTDVSSDTSSIGSSQCGDISDDGEY